MIQINNLKIKSHGTRKVINEFSFKPGIYNVYGNNGVGKSTLLQKIEDAYLNSSKSIVVSADSLLLYNQKKKMPLDTTERNLLDNLKEIKVISKEDADNYKPLYKKDIFQYSEGEYKTAIIQIMTLAKPQVLLIDEPFSKLSENNIKLLHQIFIDSPIEAIIFTSHMKYDLKDVVNIDLSEILC